MENKKIIPAQRIIGSNKELFIIKYEGSVIEIHRTNNLYEPLVVQMNGVLLDTIPSKQKKEITFNLEDGNIHKLEVWNERINNSPIIQALGKDGIAIIIDGVPVQNSLADPLTGLSKPKFFLWLLTAFFFFLSIALPIIQIQNGYAIKLSMILFSYIFLFILSLYAVLTFQTNPIKSIWIGIVLIVLESLYSSYFIVSTVGFNIGSIGLLIVRLVLLSSLIFSLKTLKALLDINKVDRTEKELNEVSINNTRRSKIFTIKNSLIFSSVVVIVIGLYFGVGSLISYINKPSLERDNAIVFRTDLKLPELIPYRKGDKWGYVNSQGKIVINPIYSKVEFFSENKFLRVEKDKLVGIIDSVENVIIPCKYQNIEESNRNLFRATKVEGLSGIINDSDRTIIPFDYSGMEFCENFIIAKKKKDSETISGILKYDGTILLSFMKGKLKQLSDHLIELTTEVKGKNDITPIEVKFVIDEKGKNVIPGMSFEYLFPIYISNKSRIKSGYINAIIYEFFMNDEIIEYKLKSGIINSIGEIVIPFEYDELPYLFNFNEKYICVKNNERYGIIDFKNNLILPIVYDYVFIQKKGDEFYFVVKDRFKNKSGLLKEPKHRYIGSDYNLVIPFDYDWISANDKNYNWIKVYNNNRVGAIDFNNNLVIPIEYLHMLGMTEGLAAVKDVNPDSLIKIVNSNKLKGTYYLEEIHHGLMFSNGGGGFPGIYKNPDYKFVGYTTLEIMNALSDTLSRRNYYESNYKYFKNRYPTYEGFVLTIVLGDWRSELPGKWGYFNDKGDQIIDFIYDDCESFENGVAKVKLNNKWGVINKNGEVVIPIKYSELEKAKNFDLFEVKKNNKTTGFVDLNGVEYFQN